MPSLRAIPRTRVALLGIDPAEASFAARGFRASDAAARERLELIGRTFIRGYRAALEEPEQAARLGAVELELRGFAYEGAAMALALLDQLDRGRRLSRFIAGPAAPHVFMAHVGAGWAFARLHRGPGAIRSLDSLLRWLALDGYGFHQGYFNRGGCAPRRFSGYARRAFDQGLGRSLWFVTGADIERATALISGCSPDRRGDLWSGVALAQTYAGPASPASLAALADCAAAYAPELAQGAAFAAAARVRAGNPAAHTELACHTLTGRSAEGAAALCAQAREQLPPDSELPTYETWRARLRAALAPNVAEWAC